ncbi:MAG: methyltransferase domain-containing protein [Myxococcales bacterium]|nr:methyltransferase domain-containing protein [Myxococcales bacterium]
MKSAETFWNGLAERYAEMPVKDPEAFQAKIEATRARLSPQDVILEVGCGTGSLALELSPSVAHIHATDLSSEMLRIARGKVADRGVENITFHQAAVAELGFEPEGFDMVCAFSILHLVDDRDEALRILYRLLKPGGSLVSSTVCLGESRIPFGLFLPLLRWIGKAPAVRIFDAQQLEQSIRDAGFIDVENRNVAQDDKVAFVLARRPRD